MKVADRVRSSGGLGSKVVALEAEVSPSAAGVIEVFPDNYVVETSELVRANVEDAVPRILRRTSLDGRDLLCVDERPESSGWIDVDEIGELVRSGSLAVIDKAQLFDLILRQKQNCGIGITPVVIVPESLI